MGFGVRPAHAGWHDRRLALERGGFELVTAAKTGGEVVVRLVVALGDVAATVAVHLRIEVVAAHQERTRTAGPFQEISHQIVHAFGRHAAFEGRRRRQGRAELVDARVVHVPRVRRSTAVVQGHQRMRAALMRVARTWLLGGTVGKPALGLLGTHAGVDPLRGGAQAFASALAGEVGLLHRDVGLGHHPGAALGADLLVGHRVVRRVRLSVFGDGGRLPTIDAEALIDQRHLRRAYRPRGARARGHGLGFGGWDRNCDRGRLRIRRWRRRWIWRKAPLRAGSEQRHQGYEQPAPHAIGSLPCDGENDQFPAEILHHQAAIDVDAAAVEVVAFDGEFDR